MLALKLSGIKKSFGFAEVLSNIDLEIEEKTVFGLLGPNGAGKSTLAKIVVGALKPDSGRVELFGREFRQNNFDQRKQLGMVPQEPSFYFGFTVEQNIDFFGRLYGLDRTKIVEKRNFLLKWLGLEKFSSMRAEHLSGGYKKLLNIAVSLVHSPKILLLDEPTAGLDPNNRQLFWKKIRELKQAGMTLVLTTHYMDEAQALSDKIALIKNGRILLSGNPEKIIEAHGGKGYFDILFQEKPEQKLLDAIQRVLPRAALKTIGTQLIVSVETRDALRSISVIYELLEIRGIKTARFIFKEPDLEDVFLSMTGEKVTK